MTSTATVTGRPSVLARLEVLGLKPADLTNSLLDGASAMALCTANHPPIFAGLTFYAETVRGLRDRKMKDGWSRSDARNYATVVSPDRTIQIAVARGDEWTGIEEAPVGRPSTLHPKGTATQEAVVVNQQLSLFDEVPSGEGEASAEAPLTTWVLLHFRDHQVVRSELSLPLTMNASGFVESWAERIILDELDLEPRGISLPEEPDVAPDVLVRRR